MPDIMKVFRLHAVKLGGHITVHFASAQGWNYTFAGLGNITMDESDWKQFKSDVLGAGWTIEYDGSNVF